MTEPGLQERVARLEGRVEDFGDRFDALDQRLASIDRRLDALHHKGSTHFRWLVGGQVTLLVTLVGALSAALFMA